MFCYISVCEYQIETLNIYVYNIKTSALGLVKPWIPISQALHPFLGRQFSMWFLLCMHNWTLAAYFQPYLISPWTNWLSFCRQHFHMHFSKSNVFYSNITGVCFKDPIHKYVRFGSDNGLVTNRQQPLPWASGLPVAIQWQSSMPGT